LCIVSFKGLTMKETILDVLAAIAIGLMLAFFLTIRG
jgi:hypothetical protein